MKSVLATFQQTLCRLSRLSTAAKVAGCLMTGLLLTLIAVWTSYAWNPRYIPWTTYMSWSRASMLAVLIIGVATVAYLTVRAWLAEESSDRTIAAAWAAGMQELRNHGLPIDALPIHLILGAGSVDEEDRLLRASGEYRFIRSTPTRGLTFSANANRICVSASGVGLTALARQMLTETIRAPASPLDASLREQLAFGSDLFENSDDDALSQTLQAVGWESDEHHDDSFPGDNWPSNSADCAVMSPPAPVAKPVRRPLALIQNPLETPAAPLYSLAEASTATEELCQLANLIRSTRRPVCPINRIIVVVPVAVLLEQPDRIPELQLAVRRDLETLQQTLEVNAPVSVLISGMESHPGFVEFLRRTGPQALQNQTLGQAVDVGSPTTPSQLHALAVNACGQVEDCLYALLQKETSLSSPGNALLYRLLCDLRTGVRQSLSKLLVGAFSTEGTTSQFVAGCHFGACGNQPQQRGFLEALWRLQDHGQEQLEWLPQALERELFHRQLCRAGWIVTGGLILTWIGLLRAWWSA